MNTYHDQNETPAAPGVYWCVTKRVGPSDSHGVRTVTYSGPMHLHWNGEQWQTTEGWTHWYGEAQRD